MEKNLNDQKDHQDDKQNWLTNKSRPLGKGSYGSVYLVQNTKTGDFRALKEVIPQPNYKTWILGCTTDILREIHTLNSVSDFHIVKLIQADITYNQLLSPLLKKQKKSKLKKKKEDNLVYNPNAYILMESGQETSASWRNKLNTLIEEQKSENESVGKDILRSMFHLLLAIRALHSQKIMHNDVSPPNLLRIGKNTFKLTDFGLSLTPDCYKWKNAMVYPLIFRAPEILFNKIRANYSYPADIWAAAICMCFLLFGNPSPLQEDQKSFPTTLAIPPLPRGKTSLEVCLDLFQLIGLPSSTWMDTYLSSQPLPEFCQIYQEKDYKLLDKEQVSKNILKRFQSTYGKKKVKEIAKLVGGPTIFLQVLNLITKCLQYDPTLRPSVYECLSHPCFASFQVESLAYNAFSVPVSYFRTTPNLLSVGEIFSLPNKSQLQIKYLRKYTFEKISSILQKYIPTTLHKDEVASILACSISLFDRDWKKIVGLSLPLDENATFNPEIIKEIVTLLLTVTWLSGKYLSLLPKKICLAILEPFNHLCILSEILKMETRILNQEHFTFPKSFLRTEFSISSDLYQILNLNLDNSQDIAEEMFSILLK